MSTLFKLTILTLRLAAQAATGLEERLVGVRTFHDSATKQQHKGFIDRR